MENNLSKLPYPQSFPDTKEELFLKLILSADRDFPVLWSKWKNSVVFENIDYGILRLLPLIYIRLEKLGIKDELYLRIKGIYRLAWTKNQRILSAVEEVAIECAKRDIPVLALKGIPLLLDVYKNIGARFLGDADLLVPPQFGKKVVNMMRENGWYYTKEWSAERNNQVDSIFQVIKSAEFRNKLGVDMDIHFNIFPIHHQVGLLSVFMLKELPSFAFRNYFWQYAIPTEIKGVPCFRLSNEDMLIHIIIHGAEGNTHRALRWVIDAYFLMQNLNIDWDLILERVEKFGFNMELGLAFRYMSENLNIDIPKKFLERLYEIQPTKEAIKKYYKIANTPHTQRVQLLGNLPTLWYGYFKFENKTNPLFGIFGFPDYVAKSWGLEKKRHIFKFIIFHLKRKFIDKDPDFIENTKRVFQNSLYITGGKGLAFLASFAVVTVIGKYVPREIAGSYNYIIATLSIVSIATLPGMNTALIRSVAKGEDGNVSRMLKKRILFGLFGSLISVAIGIFSWMHGEVEIAKAFFITAPFVPLTDTFSNFAISFWQGKKRFDRSAMTLFSYYLGLAIFSIPIFILSKSLLTIVTGIMLTQSIMGFIVYKTIKKENEITNDSSINLGIHLTIMQSLSIFTSNIDKVIVWHLFGPAMVAIYAFASAPVSKAMQMIPIGNIALPHLSNHDFTEKNKKDILKKTFLLFFIMIPLALIIIKLAPFLYKIFFPKYPESIIYFQILVLGMALSPVMLLKSALIAFQKTKALYINEIATPLIKFTLMLALSMYFGMYGLVWAITIGAMLEFILTLVIFTQTQATKEA